MPIIFPHAEAISLRGHNIINADGDKVYIPKAAWMSEDKLSVSYGHKKQVLAYANTSPDAFGHALDIVRVQPMQTVNHNIQEAVETCNMRALLALCDGIDRAAMPGTILTAQMDDGATLIGECLSDSAILWEAHGATFHNLFDAICYHVEVTQD